MLIGGGQYVFTLSFVALYFSMKYGDAQESVRNESMFLCLKCGVSRFSLGEEIGNASPFTVIAF